MTSINRISSLKWLQLILLLALVIPVDLNVSNRFWSRTTFDPPHQDDGGSRWTTPILFEPISNFRVH
ncbi:MAG: hypothetical protein AAFO04_27100 [Cyanobacteria bacterium J06592_8]